MLSSEIRNTSKFTFPNFITGSQVVKAGVTLSKIFPEIGLPNYKEPFSLDVDFSQVDSSKATHLAIKKFLEKWHSGELSLSYIKGLELIKMSKFLHIMEELNKRFNKNQHLIINNTEIRLANGIPSYDKTPLVKGGADVVKLVKKILEQSEKYTDVRLYSAAEMAQKCRNVKIVFSSEGLEGAWDLATMSMRGIKSCMRWEARHCPALVGSITDPCCGILYITNNDKTRYGSKMLFRSIVRVATDMLTLKPIIVIDRLYSAFYKNKPGEITPIDEQVLQLFTKHLQQKLPNAQITTYQNKTLTSKYELLYPDHQELLRLEEHSYRDTGLNYSIIPYSKNKDKLIKELSGQQPKAKKPKRAASQLHSLNTLLPSSY